MRTLNIGCGKDTLGTDFVDLYPQRPEVQKCDIDVGKLPYEDATFDKVYSCVVFEHLTNHANYMQEACRVLKPGGELEIITDNASFAGLWFGSFADHVYISPFGDSDNHFALFTPIHLKNFAKKFGFTNAHVEYIRSVESPNFIKYLIKVVGWVIAPKLTCVRLRLIAEKKEKK